jgi:hypothetical protein
VGVLAASHSRGPRLLLLVVSVTCPWPSASMAERQPL